MRTCQYAHKNTQKKQVTFNHFAMDIYTRITTLMNSHERDEHFFPIMNKLMYTCINSLLIKDQQVQD